MNKQEIYETASGAGVRLDRPVRPPRCRRTDETADEYRVAMGWDKREQAAERRTLTKVMHMATLKDQKESKETQQFKTVVTCSACKKFNSMHNRCRVGEFKIDRQYSSTCNIAESKYV